MSTRFWRWLLPAYLWCLPMTLAGLLISKLFYKAHSYKWHDGVLGCIGGIAEDGTTRIWGKPNAQTLGWLVIYDSEYMRGQTDLRVHEYQHVIQAFACGLVGATLVPILFAALGWPIWLGVLLGGWVGGLGFAALYAILFAYLYRKLGKEDWYHAYRANPFEIQAYRVQDEWIADQTKKPWGY